MDTFILIFNILYEVCSFVGLMFLIVFIIMSIDNHIESDEKIKDLEKRILELENKQ